MKILAKQYIAIIIFDNKGNKRDCWVMSPIFYFSKTAVSNLVKSIDFNFLENG